LKKKNLSDLISGLIICELPVSEKYNAPRLRSRGVSFSFAFRPDSGLTMALLKTGGGRTLFGNVANVKADWYSWAAKLVLSKIMVIKQQYRSHSWP
jgi:hypothetical protein